MHIEVTANPHITNQTMNPSNEHIELESKDVDVEVSMVAQIEAKSAKSVEPSVTAAYYYFCLDCEASRDGCRVPLTMDIASHVVERRHTNFQPIEQVLPDTGYVPLENLSYNKKWNKKVTKTGRGWFCKLMLLRLKSSNTPS